LAFVAEGAKGEGALIGSPRREVARWSRSLTSSPPRVRVEPGRVSGVREEAGQSPRSFRQRRLDGERQHRGAGLA